MIGQKGFSNSNANLGDAIISSGPATPPPVPNIPGYTPASPAPARGGAKLSPALLVVISVLATALVGVVVYLIFLAPKDTGEHVAVYEAETVSDGSQTVEETIDKFDEDIVSAKDEAEALENTFSKVGYLIIEERYEEALATLNAINPGSLNNYNQYRLYSNYAGVYNGMGNAAKASEYQKLASDANARDFDNATESE